MKQQLLDNFIIENLVFKVSGLSEAEVRQIADEHGWIVRTGAGHGMIEGKVQIGDFVYEPLDVENYTFKPRIKERIDPILKSGGCEWIIGYETKPMFDWEKYRQPAVKAVKFLLGLVVFVGAMAVLAVGLMALLYVLYMVAMVVFTLICVAAIVGGLVMVDPKYIYVTPEGTWLEIYSDYV